MWRLLLLVLCLITFPAVSVAQDQTWETCRADVASAAPGVPPVLHDCRPVEGVIDPQGRELWLRAVARRPSGTDPVALYVVGTASS